MTTSVVTTLNAPLFWSASMAESRGAKAEYTCACCQAVFTARVADRKRGWARYCSKRCKALAQAAPVVVKTAVAKLFQIF